jgi:hypothetical protein
MSRYCKTQGQVLSDIHWCETCPQIEPEPNWRSMYEDMKKQYDALEQVLRDSNLIPGKEFPYFYGDER